MSLVRVLGVLCVVASLIACPSKKTSIAELTKKEGPVDRQEGTGAWQSADVATKFYLGDAVKTADGNAMLQLTGTAQTIHMEPHTILRFGAGKNNSAKINVDIGGIDVAGGGSVSLDIGDVKVANGGTIHITNQGVTLTIGNAELATIDGKT